MIAATYTDLRSNLKDYLDRVVKDSDNVIVNRGNGKPEPLKHNLTGKWSRRINKTDRIIYSVDGDKILVYVFSMTGHYQKK